MSDVDDLKNATLVEYRRENADVHQLSFQHPGLPDLRIDYTGLSRNERAGTATKLLCASALYCSLATLAACLEARGVEIKSLGGRAWAEQGRNERYQMQVKSIKLEIDLDVGGESQEILDKCRKIMERGCLITSSLPGGLTVEHTLNVTAAEEAAA